MSDDLAVLREEVAALRARLDAIEKFVAVDQDPSSGELSCSLNAARLRLEETPGTSGRIELDFRQGAPRLALIDRADHLIFDVHLTEAGRPIARIFGSDEASRVNLTTDQNGYGAVAVFGPESTALATMRGGETGGSVSVIQRNGKAAATLGMIQGPGLYVFSTTGKLAIVLGAQDENAGLIINDPQERQLIALGSTSGGSTLLLNDDQGRRGATLTAKADKTVLWMIRPGTEKDGLSISADAKGTGLYLLRSGQTVAQLGDFVQGFTLESKVPGAEMKLESPEIVAGAGLSLRSTTGINLELRSAPVGEQISIKNKDSAPLLKIGATAAGGHLALFNEVGLEVAELGGSEHGGALQIAGPTGPQALVLSGPEHGCVIVRNAEGQTMSTLPPDIDVRLESDDEP